jgi:hypothetical protein
MGIVRLPKTMEFFKAELLKKNKFRVFEASGNSAFFFYNCEEEGGMR